MYRYRYRTFMWNWWWENVFYEKKTEDGKTYVVNLSLCSKVWPVKLNLTSKHEIRAESSSVASQISLACPVKLERNGAVQTGSHLFQQHIFFVKLTRRHIIFIFKIRFLLKFCGQILFVNNISTRSTPLWEKRRIRSLIRIHTHD